MAAKTGIIKTTTVKAYITKAKKMRPHLGPDRRPGHKAQSDRSREDLQERARMDLRAREPEAQTQMTQGQLAKAIAKEFFLSQVDAAAVLDSILARMTASLQKGEWVYFKDFGSFTKKTRPGRHVRHPKTGQLIWIPPRLDVDFNPAKGLLKAKRR